MGVYSRPPSLDAALALLAERPRTLLAGGTDHFPARVGRAPDEDVLDLTALPGLRGIVRGETGWVIPCLATWSDVTAAALPPLFDGLKQAARQVGGLQVQTVATVVGNVCNASPAADGIPVLLSLNASVELVSVRGTRVLPLAEFVLGPRRTARREDEIVRGLHIPAPAGVVRTSFGKLGARRYLVISIVAVSAFAELDPEGRIARARVAVGACAPVACRLPVLETALEGAYPDPALVTPACLAPLAPIDDVRASAEYRRRAALEMLRRAVADLREPQARAA
jgi:CO/xanthine dehydrogenase FAD-binding subunit